MKIFTTSVVITSVACFVNCSLALECPKFPEQAKKDWEVSVSAEVAKIGPLKGAELKTTTRNITQDLLGKLPDAGRVYLEQMMFATYCTALRDDRNLTDAEKSKRLKEYIGEVRKVTHTKSSTKPKRKPAVAKKEVQTDTKRPVSSSITDKSASATTLGQSGRVAPEQKKDSPQSNISQTMTNSPGGIQAGHDVVILNEKPPRSVTTDQRVRFVTALKRFGPHEVSVTHAKGNRESQEFADQIITALRDGGWQLKRPQFLITEHEAPGIWVLVTNSKDLPPGADELLSALESAGLECKGVEVPALHQGTLSLHIGYQ